MSDLNDLAAAVQQHVPVHPWGRYGDRPAPLNLSYDADQGLWSVKFPKAVKGERMQWGYAKAPSLTDALQQARSIQMGGRS